MSENLLYYGDNLDVMGRHIKDESIDLVYLDPPFNSSQDYNVLFKEQNGSRSAAQIKAFEDTWHWDQGAAEAYEQVVEGGGRVAEAMRAFRTFLSESDMMAYLAMMAPRLIELRRVMKPTASIYLHCDPTASHYLKMLLDSIFGAGNFLNEIVWKRTHAHGSSRRYGPLHDVILFYGKCHDYFWANYQMSHATGYIEKHFRMLDESTGKRFAAITLTGSGVRHGESGKPWRGIDPTKVGRHWALPSAILEELGISTGTVQERLDALNQAGLVFWPGKKAGTPRLKWFVEGLHGQAIPDIWNDISPISAHASERIGYPTQKPEALLERIIKASSKEGDIVLDPFCGCGTAIAVAQKLNRQWIGIDITQPAITLIKHRLQHLFGDEISKSYKVIGEPVSLADAQQLAVEDPYQFQWWALGLVGARLTEQKKGADRGIDGRLYFHDKPGDPTKQIILSVKAGGYITSSHLRDLRGVLEREKAEIGVLICMEEPTRPMRSEAASAGFYKTPYGNHPKIQILTIKQILKGARIDYPPQPARLDRTFKKAPKVGPKGEQLFLKDLPLVAESDVSYPDESE